ncbi:MAG: PHP domain-containing protein [bacterium]|nr:PHP domain-containing protein [bacterium]
MIKNIDLHIHSIYSDGRFTPNEIIETAKKNNVGILSITDHDTIDAYRETLEIDDMILINGVEISAFYKSKKGIKTLIHILGYDLDFNDKELLLLLENLKDYRYEVNKKYLLDLMKKYNYLSTDILKSIDCSKYYRLWWAIQQYMQSAQYSEEEILTIKKYCRHNYPFYPEYDIESKKAIEAIKNAKGIPVIAHPYEYHLSDLEFKRMLRELIDFGLEGIETYHSECPLEYMNKLRMLVESYKLIYTVGSDFHFPTEEKNKIIGLGIDNNLCSKECSLPKIVLERRKY